MSEHTGPGRPADHQDPTPPDVAVTLAPAGTQEAPEPAGAAAGTAATPTDDVAEPDGHPT